MAVSVNYQLDRISDHLGHKSLAIPVGDYLDCIHWLWRPVLIVRGPFPGKGILDCIHGEKGLRAGIHSFIFLLPGCGCHVTNCFSLLLLLHPAMMEWALELPARNPFPSSVAFLRGSYCSMSRRNPHTLFKAADVTHKVWIESKYNPLKKLPWQTQDD